MAACDVDTLLTDACSNGFSSLSERDLKIAILQLLCDGGGTGGLVGVVNPEGAVSAAPGRTYYNTALQTFWVKASGTGNTGWDQVP